MSSFNVSSRYAKALINLSTEKGNFESVAADVELIYNSLIGSKELKLVLSSPVINEEKKDAILDEIFKTRISNETMIFLKFIVSKRREDILTEIMRRFIELKNDKMSILEVLVQSYTDMSADQKKMLEKKLKAKTGKSVLMTYQIDEKVVGGFKLRFKDTVIDASVQHQLDLLHKSFLGEKLISNN